MAFSLKYANFKPKIQKRAFSLKYLPKTKFKNILEHSTQRNDTKN